MDATSEKRAGAFDAIRDLRARPDDDATRALVALLEHEDEAIALEAARAIYPRALLPDLRSRVGALTRDRLNVCPR